LTIVSDLVAMVGLRPDWSDTALVTAALRITTNPLRWRARAQGNIFFRLAFLAPMMVVANAFDSNRCHFPMMRRTRSFNGGHRSLLPAITRAAPARFDYVTAILGRNQRIGNLAGTALARLQREDRLPRPSARRPKTKKEGEQNLTILPSFLPSTRIAISDPLFLTEFS
jgi:hypothetical protein